MTQITTLLFDLGDVLVDNNWQRSFSQLIGHMKDNNGKELNLEQITEKLHPGSHSDIWNDFGVGKISRAEFLENLITKMAFTGDHVLLEQALTKISEPIHERINLLNKLIDSGNYKIGIVSDTNEMHMTHIEVYIPSIFNKIPTENRFYSHNLGLEKRNGQAIYESVLKSLDVQPQNALMIDDRIKNKEGADAIGLNFLLIQKNEDLEIALRSDPYNLVF
jgi:putative hydrolase of the HAD superfamily